MKSSVESLSGLKNVNLLLKHDVSVAIISAHKTSNYANR